MDSGQFLSSRRGQLGYQVPATRRPKHLFSDSSGSDSEERIKSAPATSATNVDTPSRPLPRPGNLSKYGGECKVGSIKLVFQA
jgi:hypothetical protein